jgi:putative phosphoribosyl transferase
VGEYQRPQSKESGQGAVLEHDVQIPSGDVQLEGELALPPGAEGVVIFAHGSGSSRRSPRNRRVARTIRAAGLGTLLLDLLTGAEDSAGTSVDSLRFDIDLLAARLTDAARWVLEDAEQSVEQSSVRTPRVGFFGASTGGGAALVAAAEMGGAVGAVVSRGGRPDLAGAALSRVLAPTLLIVGGRDEPVIELNERAFERMRCKKGLWVVPGATHLFEEPGALDEVARLATEWFRDHLPPPPLTLAERGTQSGPFARPA